MLLMTTNLKRKDGAVDWIEVPSHESTIIFSSTAPRGRRYVANSITWTQNNLPPSNVLSPLCVPYCCLLLLFFQSLWYCLVRGGEGVARSGGKEELEEQQKKENWESSKRRQSAKRQQTPNSTAVYSFYEADWGGWSWLKNIDDVFNNFSFYAFLYNWKIYQGQLKDIPGT